MSGVVAKGGARFISTLTNLIHYHLNFFITQRIG